MARKRTSAISPCGYLPETPAAICEFTGLRKLRDRMGDAFVAGIAFHMGNVGYEMEDRIHSLPMDRLWI